jgi:hypothetical protein
MNPYEPNDYRNLDPQLSQGDTDAVADSLGLDRATVAADYAALGTSDADKRRRRYMALALAIAIAQAD